MLGGMALPVALLLISGASASEVMPTSDTSAGSCDLRDAELYLTDIGIPPNLPELEVMYGHFTTREVYVHGSETRLTMGDKSLFADAPRVKWIPNRENEHAKYAVLMVDPDWPERAKHNGSKPGKSCALTSNSHLVEH